jgi:polyvinyl alcohol dehydrogenase (cytochrome)
MEEARAGASDWPCCSFRGSFQKLSAATGAVAWKTYTTPQGWSGTAVWGSAPPIDAARGQIVIATGDNYDFPPGELAAATL